MKGLQLRRLLQINLRTVMVLMVLVALVMAWYRDHTILQARISELEAEYSNTYRGWSVSDALGKPDEPTGSGANAWCPATEDGQREWLELTYTRRVRPSAILIHETYATGAVDKVSVFDWWGNEVVVWSGKDPTPPGQKGLLSIVPTRRISTKRVKIYLDSANVSGWNCIDAVGLQASNGTKYWADSAAASSSYGARYGNSYQSVY